MNHKFRSHLALLALLAGLGAATCPIWPSLASCAPLPQEATQSTKEPTNQPQATGSVVYENKQYGFRFFLPQSWKGYSVFVEREQAILDSKTLIPYPKIHIRHPLWTQANTRLDILIDIFTHSQWDLINRGRLSVTAAPFWPDKWGENAKYVFVLLPRWYYQAFPPNYNMPSGHQEMNAIIESNPLHPF